MDIENNRNFLKAVNWQKAREIPRDQEKGLPAPPQQKPYDDAAVTISLIESAAISIPEVNIKDIFQKRRSHRSYTDQALTMEQLSFLLWATQGVSGNKNMLRTSPSAGARHPFETYLVVQNVKDLNQGLYRYLPLEHKLLLIKENGEYKEKLKLASLRQGFVADSPLCFIWTVLPYRSEWRYNVLAHKVIAIDIGHVCQNLYLACEAIDLGTCAIGAYHQEIADKIVEVDGKDEYTIYMASVGCIK